MPRCPRHFDHSSRRCVLFDLEKKMLQHPVLVRYPWVLSHQTVLVRSFENCSERDNLTNFSKPSFARAIRSVGYIRLTGVGNFFPGLGYTRSTWV